MTTLELAQAASITASCLYGVALGAMRWHRPVARGLLVSGWLATATLFCVNWHATGPPPFGSMYHVLVAVALCFSPLYLLLSRRAAFGWLMPHFALGALIPLVGTIAMSPTLHWRQMPALQSPWFVPHVFSYVLSYSLMAVAFTLLVSKWCARHHEGERMQRHDRAIITIIRMSLPFMTFGLFSGAVWADVAWGNYWSWDPKETWSLITWVLYLIVLHAHHDRALKRWRDVAHLAAFLALLSTFILVNVLPRLGSVLHGYAVQFHSK